MITPRRIRRFLRRKNVPCDKCGYSLVGLPEPRCPECGHLNDLTEIIRAQYLRKVNNRLGSLGTIDGYLIHHTGQRLQWAHRYSQVRSLEIIQRWGEASRRWLVIAGCLLVAMSLFCLVLFAAGLGLGYGAAAAGAMLVALGLLVPAVAIQPQHWVLVHLSDQSRKVPMRDQWGSDLREGVNRLVREIEDNWRCPPAPELDYEAEEVKEGCCPACGYRLAGPPLMIGEPDTASRMVGGLLFVLMLIVVGLFGSIMLDSLSGVGLVAGIFVLLGAFVGLWATGARLSARTRQVPAVPDWNGGQHCPACGWRK